MKETNLAKYNYNNVVAFNTRAAVIKQSKQSAKFRKPDPGKKI